MAACVTFEAVMVAVPTVFKVTFKLALPADNGLFAGRTARASLEVIRTVSLVLMRFQFASTAWTVIGNAEPVICVLGVPVFPVALPGAAVSPGASNCIFANAAALTPVVEPGLGVFVPSVISDAVTV